MPNFRSPYFWVLVASPIALVWVQIVKPSAPIVIIVGIAAVSAYAVALWFWLSKFQYPDVATRRHHEIGLRIFGVGIFVLAVILGFLLQHQTFLPATDEAKTSGPPQRNDNTGESQNNKTTEQLRIEELQRRQTHPYTIPKADQEEFIRLLKLSGKFSVNIEFSFDDPLAGIFAEELATLLTLSKWEINSNEPESIYVTGRKYPAGVTITTNEGQEVPTGATLLINLLRKHNIETHSLSAPPRKSFPASFDIFIGHKQ